MKILRLSFLTVIVLTIFGAAADIAGQTRRPVLRRNIVTKAAPAPSLFRINAGKKIRVRMNDSVSSGTARVGDTFTVTTTEPVYSTTGAVVIPTGSEMVGRITTVTRALKGGRPGSMDASFIRVRLPNGYTKAINGSLTEVDDRTGIDNEGGVRGRTMKNRKVIFIGGGGVGGAILGGAIGGPKGALIGGLLGAGAGLLGERNTKGKEAEVNAGTEFGVYLNQAVSLPRYKEVE